MKIYWVTSFHNRLFDSFVNSFLEISSHITDRYLGNQQNLLFQFVQIGINLDTCPNSLPIPIDSMTPITIELLLDYGMVSQIWFSDKTKLASFPYKLKKSCELNLFPNKSLYIDIDSILPELANKNNHSYEFLPSYHFICLYAFSINDSERF